MKNSLFILCIFLTTCSRNVDRIEVRHQYDEYLASIKATGITSPLTIMHITDSHISVIDSAESEFYEFSARMDKAYINPTHYQSEEEGTRMGHFLGLIQQAKDAKVDLIVLTGDILNNPSRSSIDFVYKALEDSGIEYVYTSGNHDWHYEGMEGTADELRETWITKGLKPLYRGQNPLYYAVEKAGINFVAIDNSTYQVNRQQLDFFKNELKKNKPTVLLCHIPIYTGIAGEKVNTCGDPKWGFDTDRGFETERRHRWPKTGNLPSTTQFVEEVNGATNLIAVLCGHTHRAQVDTLQTNLLQYRTRASYSGAHRIVTFESLN
jgi:3',5'-cyclic AMP phosphodiesterase CpdA